ncbi:MAG: type II restriction endonuclease [Acidobacteriales bacterium]|nr:type II restriction endonuclease [Terriglobales bacterium]
MKPHRGHLRSAEDLITLPQDTRAGFVGLALERNRRATPYVAEGRALRVEACKVSEPILLKQVDQIQAALLTAAGVSDKAAGYFEETDKTEAIDNLIAEFLEPAGVAFVEEVVYRFLLTRGDTLGGSMRNVGGVLAQRKLSRYLMAALTNAGIPYRWLHATNNTWTDMTANDAGIEQFLKGLSWSAKKRNRTLVFNLKVPLVGTNVDLLLLNVASEDFGSEVIRQPERFVALGELKGGIDPAGADEHWKTATKALDRIRRAFKKEKRHPPLCYIGAAIARNMANEIWEDLEAGELANAANLTREDQVASLCSWLCEL